jgi:hypothetical protein
MPTWPFTFSGAPPAPVVNVATAGMPTSTTEIQSGTLYLLGLCFTNTSGAIRTITVEDTAGVDILKDVEVPPNGVASIFEFPFMPMTGLKWFASGSGVNGRAWGY